MRSKFILQFILGFSCAVIFAPVFALADSPPITMTNSVSLNLRDQDLKNPIGIEKDSEITLDPKFLKQYLGTETPTAEQIQQLLLNPTEVSKSIVTQTAREARTGKTFSDYFFPVIVKNKTGKISTGTMALQAYARDGMISVNVPIDDSPKSNAIRDRIKNLRDQNTSVVPTEAGSVSTCPQCDAATAAQQAAQLAAAISLAARQPSNNLYQKYQAFARDFTTTQGKVTHSNAPAMKRLFIKSMIDKLGIADASAMIEVLTAYGEAPYRKNSSTEIGEMAAIMKVIENRANSKMHYNSRTLRDIGVDVSANRVLTAALADSQFSVWNDFDNNLARIMNFNPDRDPLSVQKMELAFESERMMRNNQIEFIGKMNSDRMYNYHANYVAPRWARSSQRIAAPIVRVKRVDDSGREVAVDVNLANQRGARHIFYAGT